MTWHVLSSTRFDFEHFAEQHRLDRLPHHLLPRIADRIGAPIHQPAESTSRFDRLAARLYDQAPHWATARALVGRLEAGDCVYAAGDDAGVPLALLCMVRRKRVAFAIAFADPGRTRTKIVGWLLALSSLRVMAVVTTEHLLGIARGSFGKRLAGCHVIEGQTDCGFFRPLEPDATAPAEPERLVASCGVEQRDYATLGRALGGGSTAVKVCFASPNQTDKTRFTMPDPVPPNFEFRHFEFAELRDLYQRADVVVLPLLDNRYSAGLTSLFEAMACAAPVVVTRAPGIIGGLIDEGAVSGAAPGDAEGLAAAVDKLLGDPVEARRQGHTARSVVATRYSADVYLDRLEKLLMALCDTVPAAR